MISSLPKKQIKIIIVVLVALTILLNCKKEKPNECWDGNVNVIQEHSLDTIYPSDYIMAYPGSWWEYDSGRIDSCYEWIPQKIYVVDRKVNCTYVYEDLKYLPRTSFGTIHLNSIIKDFKEESSTQYIPWTNTTASMGQVAGWRPNEQSYHSIKLELMQKLDSFSVLGIMYYDIIHCKLNSKTNYYKYPFAPNTVSDYYFAKSIGIIKTLSSRSPFTPYYSDTSRLVNHYIAPH